MAGQRPVAPPLVLAICDPVREELNCTKAVVRRLLDSLPLGRFITVRAYLDPAALLSFAPCDICVTETDLGDIDGFTFIERIRRQHKAAVIYLTKDATNASALKAWQLNAESYLLKPLERPEDLDRFRTALNQGIERVLYPPLSKKLI